MAPADEPATTAPSLPGLDQGGPHRAVLEDRAQVQRRAAAEVDEAGRPHLVRPCRASSASRRVSTIRPRAVGPERGEPAGGGVDGALGMFVGGGGRQDQHLGPAAGLPQLGVEGAPGGPLGPADQGQGSRSAGRSRAPRRTSVRAPGRLGASGRHRSRRRPPGLDGCAWLTGPAHPPFLALGWQSPSPRLPLSPMVAGLRHGRYGGWREPGCEIWTWSRPTGDAALRGRPSHSRPSPG